MRAAAYRLAAVLLALATIALTVASASAPASVPASNGASHRRTEAALARIRVLARWAYPQQPAAAHRRPSVASSVIGRLRFLTADGQAQVYLALRSYTTHGVAWILVQLPGRPNGRSGWVPASALGEMHVPHEYLRVDRERLRATLYRAGREIWSAPVGVGRAADPTPAGLFYVTEKLTAIGGPFYGPYALGTSAYAPTLSEWPGGGVVGIHGTDEPTLIPGRPSHGCVRLRNTDMGRLWPLISVGIPIEIV
jgi:L,D-transpeptidase catalytic domain